MLVLLTANLATMLTRTSCRQGPRGALLAAVILFTRQL